MDRFIFEEYRANPSALGLYRILFAGYLLFMVLPVHLWVTSFPDSFFNPPAGLTMFFTRFPPNYFFLVINVLLILTAVCLLFGHHTRIASVGLALLLLVSDSWAYSFGKINHDILIILMPPIMQVAGWGNAYSMDRRRHPSAPTEVKAWPVALMALIVALAMFTAAVSKATTGWLEAQSHAVHAHLLFNYFVTGRTNWVVKNMLFIHSGTFWECFDYTTVLLESSFLLTVLWRPAFRVVCALACFFHFGIAVTMEIAYVANLLVYAAFFDWSILEDRVPKMIRGWNWILDRTSISSLLLLTAAIAFIYLRFGNPLGLLFPQEWDPLGITLCTLAALLAALFLIRVARNFSLKAKNHGPSLGAEQT